MSAKSIFKTYINKLSETALRGDAREESFYQSLADMIREIARENGRTDIDATTLPRSTDAGNPDFRVWDGNEKIVGYIEAKKPTEERLDYIETSDQLKRYLGTFDNLILTNFLEFRLYRKGELIDSVMLGRPAILNKVRYAPPVEKADELLKLLDMFFSFSQPKPFTAESLAVELAKRTRFLREVVNQQLALELNEKPGGLAGFYEAFQQFLIGALTPADFANLFAQTIAYGLFAARTRATNSFSRKSAFDNIPRTIGVLRDLFRFISLDELPDELAWCVDEIAQVLAVADAPGILDRYYREGKGSDPIVHFYETFLAQYDPAERERRGVYYTPEPVVSYIVRSLHNLLKSEFGQSEGLASKGVTLLDPAAGTMTFVARAAQEAVAEFERNYGAGSRGEFVKNHILKNFYAFELMMAPYAVGHLKMGFFLEELGHRLADDERMPFYLTNTLDFQELEESNLPGLSSLAEESHLAGEVKKQTPILVILGNPPYSGHSSNRGDWILGLIDDYKMVDGQPLGERNPKWLQDDYVKFLRFAQWKIEQSGAGVVGMITNHGYLDNPTFRGMRQSLMKTFDEIYILDLHGNSLKKETCPDGSKDENVFDIRQGVAIAFFVKHTSGTPDNKYPLPSEKKASISIKSPLPMGEEASNGAKHPLPPGEGQGEGSNNKNTEPKPPLPPQILNLARMMRKKSTDAESKLWWFLRNRHLGGFKFRRQHPIENRILDFYCHEKKLGIELDGGQHGHSKYEKEDNIRTSELYEHGVRIVRFWNKDVLKNTLEVLEHIWELLHCGNDYCDSPPGGCGGINSINSLTPTLSRGERVTNGASDNNMSGRSVRNTGEKTARVFHSELWGVRQSKYERLESGELVTTEWVELKPQTPFYFFAPRDTDLEKIYYSTPSVPDIFPTNSVGIVTSRDGFVLDFDKETLKRRIRQLCDRNMTDELLKTTYGLKDKKDWKVADIRSTIRADENWQDKIQRCLYRPFDERWLFYHFSMIERARSEVMRHMLAGENLGLITCRQLAKSGWLHAMVSEQITDDCVISNRTKERGYLFPLYLYPSSDSKDLFSASDPSERSPNINPRLIASLENGLGLKYRPDAAIRNAATQRSAGSQRSAGILPAGSEASSLRNDSPAGSRRDSPLEAGATNGGVSKLRFGSVEIRDRGRLPHWESEGAIYFITLRLADSLPASVLDSFRHEREQLERKAIEDEGKLTYQQQTRIKALMSERVEQYLDSGAGECHLKNPHVAKMLTEALKHGDEDKYRLIAWCIMPNHVHIVFRPYPGRNLSNIMHSLKSFTANSANRILDRQGSFWQKEYYDRIIRDEDEYRRTVEYVLTNPERAGFKDWEWVGCRMSGAGFPLGAGSQRSAGILPAGSEASSLRNDSPAGCRRDSPLEAGATNSDSLQEAGATNGGASNAFGPEDIFYYIYAVLYSPSYREKYAAFLRSDFPRVPFTADAELFARLAVLGERLAELHLLKSPELNPPTCRFEGEGDGRVEKGMKAGLRYDPDAERVYINAEQYFGPVPPEVWEYQVGGYQVCEKWLKDRRERRLELDDIRTYCRIVTALKLTIVIQSEIDEMYPAVEAETIEMD